MNARARAARLWAALGVIAAAGCTARTEYHLIARGDPVRFFEGPGAPPADWLTRDFDDASWALGPTPLGFGGGERTELAAATGASRTIFVRRRFDGGPAAATIRSLDLDLDLDAGLIVFVNGVEVRRAGLLPGAPLDAAGVRGVTPARLRLPVAPGLLGARGNVLALEVHLPEPPPRRVAIEPRLGVGELDRSALALRKGPYLQRVGPDAITVSWETTVPAPGRVLVDGLAFSSPAGLHHEVVVGPLAPGRPHPYVVEVGAAGEVRSEPGELRVAAPAAEPFSFLVYGDDRTGGDDHRRVVEAMTREGADFVVNTGDMVSSGGDEAEWDAFFSIEYDLLRRVALYPALGNHEADGGGARRFAELFALDGDPSAAERYYAFDFASAHVVVLDSNQALDGAQGRWLDADLLAAAARPGLRHRFAVLHHGPYSAGASHGSSAAAQRALVPALRRFGVELVFAGHDHVYERGEVDGLRYFVTGGGGAPLDAVGRLPSTLAAASLLHYLVVEVRGDEVAITARSDRGDAFDQLTFTR